MPTYDPILPAEVAAGQPITSSLITKLRDNPLALISAVPTELVSPSNTQTTDYTSTYQVPTGVTLLMVICVGGGGGGNTAFGLYRGGSSGCVRCGFVTTTGGASITYTIGGAGAGGIYSPSTVGADGGDTVFDGSVIGKGGKGGSGRPRIGQGAVNLGGVGGPSSGDGQDGEQRMVTGGTGGNAGTFGGGGGGAGVPWFLRTSSLGNGGNGGGGSGAGGNATGRGAGGGGGILGAGSGTSGIIFVLPLQA